MAIPNDFEDEQALIRFSQAGDLEAFACLVRRHQTAIRAFLLARLSQTCDAEDLAQEVFLTAYRQISGCDPNRPMLPWLRGIAQNLWRNYLRKFRPIPLGGSMELQELIDAQGQDEAQQHLREDEKILALRECLERVPSASRALLKERYMEGYSVAHISKSTGRGCSALTMQLHRLRGALAECVQSRLTNEAR